MSAQLYFDRLTKSQLDVVQKCLIMQPKRMLRRGMPAPPPVDPISFFQIEETKEGDIISLPYRFACMLTGQILNVNLPHGSMKCELKIKLRDYQIEPMLEAEKHLKSYGTTTLGLYPGWGKTIAGAVLSRLVGLTTLVFVHIENISKQWVKTFNKVFEGARVWMVDDRPPEKCPDFFICMSGRWDKIPPEWIPVIGTMIVDEAHCFCTQLRGNAILSIHPRYVIVETATLPRDDDMHKMMYALAGNHAINKVSKQPYYVFALNTGVYVEEQHTRYGLNYTELCKSLAADEQRNQMIVDIVKTNPHRKFMVLSRLSAHVELLQSLFSQANIENDTLYGTKKGYNDSTVLIGTIPKMGTGFDEAALCENFKGRPSDVLIMAHSMRKWQLYEQVRGRVMRTKNPIVIWFNDVNKNPQSHFKNLRGWMDETNATVIEMQYLIGQVRLP